MLSQISRTATPHVSRFLVPRCKFTLVLKRPVNVGGTNGNLFSTSTRPKSPVTMQTDQTRIQLPDHKLKGKVVVVTGGGQGLGLNAAEAIVKAGATVSVLDWQKKPTREFLEAQARLQEDFGGVLEYHRIDVSDSKLVHEEINAIADKYNRLDGLFAAAAVQYICPALDYPAHKVMEMLEVNVAGVLCTGQACAKAMLKYGCSGSIVFVASMSGIIANKGLSSIVYNASKAAVMSMTRSLAMELGKDGIRVNSICPGNIYTPMVAKNFEDQPSLKELWESENMLGRISRPDEYQGAIIYLLGATSSFQTGSCTIIDGGYTAW